MLKTVIILSGLLLPVAAGADSFYPACLGKTCSLGQCTEDWAGGKPLSTKGMRACCQYGGTAYSSAGVVFCKGKKPGRR